MTAQDSPLSGGRHAQEIFRSTRWQHGTPSRSSSVTPYARSGFPTNVLRHVPLWHPSALQWVKRTTPVACRQVVFTARLSAVIVKAQHLN